MGQQKHYNDVLKTTVETQAYVEVPWKLSKEKCRPTTHHMMRTLASLFDRGPSFKHSFYFLKELRLGRDCLNTNINVTEFDSHSTFAGSNEPIAHPAIRMMSGIARSCPSLEVIDFSGVLSLNPESLVYLFFRDAFETLHKVKPLNKLFNRFVWHQHLIICFITVFVSFNFNTLFMFSTCTYQQIQIPVLVK